MSANNEILQCDIKIIPKYDNCTYPLEGSEHSLCAEVYKEEQLLGTIEGNLKEILSYECWCKRFGYNVIGYISTEQRKYIVSNFLNIMSKIDTVYRYDYKGCSMTTDSYIYMNYRISSSSITEISNLRNKSGRKLGQSPEVKEVCNFVYNQINLLMKNSVNAKIIIAVKVISTMISRLLKSADVKPSFAVYVCAETGAGKTSAVLPLINADSGAVNSFEDSLPSIMTAAKTERDTILVIDDMSKYTRPGMIEKVEEITRISGDKTTNAQRMRGNKVDDSNVECLLLMSGETIPKLQNSSYPRMLILKLDKDEIDKKVLTELQKRGDDIAWFFMYIIQYTLQHNKFTENLIEVFLTNREKYRKQIAEYKIHGRYIDICSWLVTAWGIVDEFLKNNGINTSDDNFIKDCEELVLRQGLEYTSKPPEYLFLSALFELIENNGLRVVSYNDAKNDKDKNYDIIATECCEYLIKSKVVYRKISSYYKELNVDFPYSEKEIQRNLLELNILIKEGKYFTMEFKNRDNKSTRVYKILVNKAKKVTQKEENDNE